MIPTPAIMVRHDRVQYREKENRLPFWLCNIVALDRTHNLRVQEIAERNKTASDVDQFIKIRRDDYLQLFNSKWAK